MSIVYKLVKNKYHNYVMYTAIYIFHDVKEIQKIYKYLGRIFQ